MATEMMSHWPVRMSLPLTGDDRDGDGFLTDDGIARLFGLLRAEYLDGCATLVDVPLVVDGVVVARGGVGVAGRTVSGSVAVVEVFPDHVTMSARIRPGEGPGIAGTASCRAWPQGGVSREVQAELIARAQGARLFH